MKDMRKAINKAIGEYDENGVQVKLTKREKELIEYGYIQCALQIGYDIVSKGESFMAGLQELAKFNSFIDEGFTEESLRCELESWMDDATNRKKELKNL